MQAIPRAISDLVATIDKVELMASASEGVYARPGRPAILN
jgi:hypothetical protein